MIYAVIDTNVIVSALITQHPDAATVKVLRYIKDKRICPLYDADILDEYKAVLQRKKLHINSDAAQAVIDIICANGMNVQRHQSNIVMPDEDDRVFYEVSLSKDDSFLVTGNLKHYPISPRIVSPRDFVSIVES